MSIFRAFFFGCNIVGVLSGAILLKQVDAFTFYCVMTAVIFANSFFFLLLSPVRPQSLGLVKPAVKAETKLTPDGNKAEVNQSEL